MSPRSSAFRARRSKAWPGYYAFLHLAPVGRYHVLFSDNVTDRMAGSEALRDRLCTNLWIERGKVSEDGLVSVDTTSCTGICDQGPALLVNGAAIPRLDDARIDAVADLIREAVPLADWPAELFAIDDNVRRSDVLLGANVRPGDSLRAAIARGERDPELASNERSWRERVPTIPAGPDRDARGDQALEPARPRGRRLHHRPQVGGLPHRARARGATWSATPTRASRDVQGPRAPRPATPTSSSRA